MKLKKIYFILGVLIIFVIGAHFYNKSYHEKIMSSPKKYCYQTFFGPPNSAMIIEDLAYKNSLIKYYELMEKGENPKFDFPLKTLPQFEPVYVVGYTEDSMLVEVVSYYDRGAYAGGSFLRGYVYYKTIHEEPAKK